MSIQPVAAHGASPTFSAITQLFKGISRRRSERLVLDELLTMPPGRLKDLGIDTGDVFEAIRRPSQAGFILAERRAIRALGRVSS